VENLFTKLSSKLPRVSFFWDISWDNPLLLLDAYRHTFTFVTVQHPKVEKGVTFVAGILKIKFALAFYVERPYEVRSKVMQAWRAKRYGQEKKETDSR